LSEDHIADNSFEFVTSLVLATAKLIGLLQLDPFLGRGIFGMEPGYQEKQ
jgi:hypothetical protein